jgi:Sortase (surface protein transpeptidase)
MGVNMVLVNGTDHETLKKGPGRDGRTFMPGENRLIYIADIARRTSRRFRTSTGSRVAIESRSRSRTGRLSTR